MSWARNVPLSRKFTYAFGIVCCLCLVLGIYTFAAFHGVAQKSAEVSGNHLPSLIHIGEIRNGVGAERREDLELLLCQTPACAAGHIARRQKAIADYRGALKEMEPLVVPAERNYYLAFVASIEAYQDASDRAAALMAAGKTGDALDLLSSDRVVGWMNDAINATDNGVLLHAKIGMDDAQGATAFSDRGAWVNTGVTLLIVMLCALTGIALTRVTAPRIGHVNRMLERMAHKDLTVHVEVTGSDEIGQMGESLNASVATIREVVRQVAQAAETLSGRYFRVQPGAGERSPTRRSRRHSLFGVVIV